MGSENKIWFLASSTSNTFFHRSLLFSPSSTLLLLRSNKGAASKLVFDNISLILACLLQPSRLSSNLYYVDSSFFIKQKVKMMEIYMW
jgi:hypothetical protein